MNGVIQFYSNFHVPVCRPSDTLAKDIQEIANLNPQSLREQWGVKKPTVLNAIKELANFPALQNAPFKDQVEKVLSLLFATVDSEDSHCVDEFLLELMMESAEANSPFLPGVFAKCISFTQMKQWLEAKNAAFKDLWSLGDELARRQPCGIAQGERTSPSEFQAGLNYLQVLFSSMLNTFLSIFEAWGEGRDPVGNHDRWTIVQVFISLFAIPVMTYQWISAFVAVSWKAYALTALIQVVALASIALYAKCRSAVLQDCVPVSKQAKEGSLSPTTGRGEDLMALIQALLDPNSTLQPIIVAEARTGKSKLLEKFAEFLLTPEGKQLFGDRELHLVTPSSIGTKFDSRIEEMKHLLRRVKGHERRLFMVFDEIQEAMRQMNWVGFSDYLKQALNPINGMSCIAITTNEGYQDVAKDTAFAQRFKVIIPMMALSATATESILNRYLYDHNPDVWVDDEAIKTCVELTKIEGRCQPDKALALLTLACNIVRSHPVIYTPKGYHEKNEELENLQLTLANSHLPDQLRLIGEMKSVAAKGLQAIKAERERLETLEPLKRNYLRELELKMEIEDLDKVVQTIRKTARKIQRLVSFYIKERRETLQLARRIQLLEKDGIPEDLQKSFAFSLQVQQFLFNKIEDLQKGLSHETEVKTKVDKILIQSLYEQGKKNLAAVTAARASTQSVATQNTD